VKPNSQKELYITASGWVAPQKALQHLQHPAYLKLSTDENSGVKIKHTNTKGTKQGSIISTNNYPGNTINR
jgi:hypothetical protein